MNWTRLALAQDQGALPELCSPKGGVAPTAESFTLVSGLCSVTRECEKYLKIITVSGVARSFFYAIWWRRQEAGSLVLCLPSHRTSLLLYFSLQLSLKITSHNAFVNPAWPLLCVNHAPSQGPLVQRSYCGSDLGRGRIMNKEYSPSSSEAGEGAFPNISFQHQYLAKSFNFIRQMGAGFFHASQPPFNV